MSYGVDIDLETVEFIEERTRNPGNVAITETNYMPPGSGSGVALDNTTPRNQISALVKDLFIQLFCYTYSFVWLLLMFLFLISLFEDCCIKYDCDSEQQVKLLAVNSNLNCFFPRGGGVVKRTGVLVRNFEKNLACGHGMKFFSPIRGTQLWVLVRQN